MARRRRVVNVLALIAAAAAASPLAFAGVIQTDVASINGDLSRSLLGTGKGVLVGVIDTGIDDTHPALRGSMYTAKDFTASGSTDDADPGAGHGTGITGLIVGHDTGIGYTGLAPSAKFINAKVFDDNQASIGNGTLWAATKGAKVINISVGNYVNNADSAQLNMICDYIAEQYGVLVVSAAGNDQGRSAVNGVPNGNYNGVAVGSTVGRRFGAVAFDSSIAQSNDDRSKPELVAPGDFDTLAAANWEEADAYTNASSGTSFASPIVAGVAAQLEGYGRAHKLSTDPLVIKAVLMASAQHVTDTDGSAWSVRSAHRQIDGLHIQQPLDAQQGAGQVNGVAAYDLYAKKKDGNVKYANWKLSSLKENGVFTLHLGKFKAGQVISATLTWLMHIARVGRGPSGLDASDNFYQAASLADFSLTLLANGKRTVVSDSYADNFQHLSLTLPTNADYSLQVYRYAGYGEKVEDFGLATMVDDPYASAATRRARRAIASVAHAELAERGSSLAIPVSTPEPSTAMVAVGLGLWSLTRRQRRGGDRTGR
jgi:subtilisin family serine protease